MGIIIRQSIITSIISYIGIGLGFFITIYLYPRILEPEQYGLTRLLLSFALIASQFAHLGMKNTVIRFFPYFKNPDRQHHGIFFLVLFVPLIGLLLFSILFTVFKPTIISLYIDKSALFVEFYWYVIPLVAANLYFEVLNSYVRALYDTVSGSLVKDVIWRLGTIAILGLYAFGYFSFTVFVRWFVVIEMTQALILFALIIKRGEMHLRPDFKFMNSTLFKQMGSYGFYALLGGLASMMVNYIDLIMLGSLAGLGDTAIYFVAFSVGSVIAVPQRSIGKIAIPIISTAFKNNNLAEIENIYKRTSLNQVIAGLLLLIGVWANIDNLFRILPNEYAAGSSVVVIIAFAKLFDMATGINGGIIITSKHYRFDLVANIFLIVVTVITNYILIPIYGVVGAAAATTISIFFYNLAKFIFVWIKFSMQPFRMNILGVLLIGTLTLWGAYQIPYLGNLFLDIVVRSATMTVVYLGLILTLNLSSDVKSLFLEAVRRGKALVK